MIAILLLFPLRPAAAFYMVFDPTALIQEILGYIDQISQTVNTARQIENQLSSLANEAKNLANMDSRTAWQTLSGIRSNLTQVMQMQAKIRGLTMEYQKWKPPGTRFTGISVLLTVCQARATQPRHKVY